MKVSYSSKNVFKNSALSVFYKGIGMLLSMISAPLILDCLGEEKNGVWVSLLSLVSWIYYMDIGIGNGLRIRLTESLAQKKKEEAEKYISISYAILSAVSLVVFLLVVVVLQVIDLQKLFKIDANIGEDVDKIFLIAMLFVCINFVASLVNNIFFAVQNASAVSALSILGQALYILGLFLYSKTGSSLILVVAAIEGASQLIKNVVGSIWVWVKYPECRLKIQKVEKKYSKGIMSFGIQTFISNIAALILNSTDNLIILYFLGAVIVTPYNACNKYFGIIASVFATIVIPLQSAYTMAYAKKDYNWIVKNLKRALLMLAVFSIGTIVACFVFRPFAAVWLHRELSYSNGLIAYTALYCILLMVGHTFSTLTNGLGRIKETTIAAIFQAGINIPISIFLAKYCHMGVEGVILGSVVSIAISAVVGPIVAFAELRKLKETMNEEDRE